MNRMSPIYTEQTDCRDCYKCVRECSVKAIRIEHASAAVIPDRCIGCGVCVDICPAGAKKVRSDLARAKNLLRRKERVVASLAPSYAGAWPEVDAAGMVDALKRLGFYAVSETALGAEAVSRSLAARLQEQGRGLHLSTACPVVVDYIRKYRSEFVPCLTPFLSPMLSHAALIHAHFGPDVSVVFIGPCIGKKSEADQFPEEVALALTFRDLEQWFRDEGIDPVAGGSGAFEPEASSYGGIYPVVGGMNMTLQEYGVAAFHFMAVSGLDELSKMLDGLRPEKIEQGVFLEALACPGGCVGGPQNLSPGSLLESDLAVRGRVAVQRRRGAVAGEARAGSFRAQPCEEVEASAAEIREALLRVGKQRVEDELNCGGCGYETCRSFANALLVNKAEPDMCLSFLRMQAQKKANALLRCMPSGVVIVDRRLRIIECNENFALIAGSDALLGYRARPGLEGADLKKLVPFGALFEQVLARDQDYRSDAFRWGKRLIHLTIFPIEKGQTVGGILLDVTQAENRRESIARKAREVIDKNMSTVQEIACKLGEHMADTEILLRSIADDYAEPVEVIE
jgi:iron only hydrogenase large subunit-like protein